MVIAQVPLWVLHSTIVKSPVEESTITFTKKKEEEEEEKEVEQTKEKVLFLKSLFHSSSSIIGRNAIYTIDCATPRFATGGGDGKVRIWNCSALQQQSHHRVAQWTREGGYESSSNSSNDSHSGTSSPQQELNTTTTTTRLLATLATHEGASVLCVRWSQSGHYLASAGDDGHVLLYCQKKAQPTFDTTTNNNNTEHWARIRTCRGHNLDVVGLAWGKDDRFLASCSLDAETPIIIWKLYDCGLVGIPGYDIAKARMSTSSSILSPFQILGRSIHTSAVKGIAWDPIGKYLISSGDDPAICVWRTATGDGEDSWGLEARIDSRIFATYTHHHLDNTNNNNSNTKEYHPTELANLTLFRRISFSLDGSHICATNASLKGKNIAAMISREGWAISGGGSSTANNAANLIGHRQPIVASRHLPILLAHNSNTTTNHNNKRNATTTDTKKRKFQDDDDDTEPSYASIIALGDKRGFVTVWSTKSSRPIFKIQASEKSKCTITDLAWTTTTATSSSSTGVILLVSMLDGYIASFQFTWDELGGPPLDFERKSRLFRLRYGIELLPTDSGDIRIQSGGNDETKLLENAFQLTLEEDYNSSSNLPIHNNTNDKKNTTSTTTAAEQPKQVSLVSSSATNAQETKARQIESRKRGKKRIQPVLVSVDEDNLIIPTAKKDDTTTTVTATTNNVSDMNGLNVEPEDPLTSALQNAKKVAAAAEDLSSKHSTAAIGKVPNRQQVRSSTIDSPHGSPAAGGTIPPSGSTHGAGKHDAIVMSTSSSILIPPSTNVTFSVTLTTKKQQQCLEAWSSATLDSATSTNFVADCTNTVSSSGISNATLTVNRNGTVLWKDTVAGSRCTALAASSLRLVMGTYDGTIYLYGTSYSSGFPSGFVFRSFPPIVLGSSITVLQLVKDKLLVICANGDFRVYDLTYMKLLQKGSVAPIFHHVRLSAANSNNTSEEAAMPKLARAQLNAAGIVLLLSMKQQRVAGGSLQAFLYNRDLEEWQRIADSRFALSDFSVARQVPSGSKADALGTLSALESLVSLNGRGSSDHSAQAVFGSIINNAGQKNTVTRSHCEDRMACSLALGSAVEFKHWLRLYSRFLTTEGDETYLRCLCDVLLGKLPHQAHVGGGMQTQEDGGRNIDSVLTSPFEDGSHKKEEPSLMWRWWLGATTDSDILGLARVDLLRLVVAEMGRNRELQRLTNEIMIEIATL